MKRTYKTKLVALLFEYEHTQLCYTCGKEGQRRIERVYHTAISSPSFCRADIPVGWVSSYDGVYCSEKCHGLSITKKEQQND